MSHVLLLMPQPLDVPLDPVHRPRALAYRGLLLLGARPVGALAVGGPAVKVVVWRNRSGDLLPRLAEAGDHWPLGDHDDRVLLLLLLLLL